LVYLERRARRGTERDEEDPEHFGLSWPGKREARRLAGKPSAGTLVPARGEGIDEEKTHNIYIEGENLEVLKLLRKSYTNRVKMIYIDPPYNTGNDFVYDDDFTEPLQEYLKRTGQIDGEGKATTTNKKADGRFHSKWLSMMYPRLRLARELLRDDGVIFVSIDNNEVHHLRMLMNEVFGEESFVECITWNKRIPKNDKGIGSIHEYILIYKKQSEKFIEFKMRKEGLDDIYELIDKISKLHLPLVESEREIAKLYKKQDYDRGITLYNSLDEKYQLWGKINHELAKCEYIWPCL
jgi:adenine-specific DNA-methyltransferase